MKPFQLVRTYSGVPPVDAFNNFEGTPIVIDETTGNAYALLNNVVTLLGLAAMVAGFQSLTASRITWSGAQTLSTKTLVDFSPPSWATEIIVPITALSTSGASVPTIQLGTSGGIDTSSYAGSCGSFNNASSTSATNLGSGGFILQSAAAGNVIHFTYRLSLIDSATNTWGCSGIGGASSSAGAFTVGGTKSLGGALTTVRLTTSAGVDTFDGGSANAGWL